MTDIAIKKLTFGARKKYIIFQREMLL